MMKIASIAISKRKGTRKIPVEEAVLIAGHGLDGDAHAAPWHRQVSFLGAEGIERARKQGYPISVR
jgi:molybdopterin adenylyltransferase